MAATKTYLNSIYVLEMTRRLHFASLKASSITLLLRETATFPSVELPFLSAG